MPDKGFIICSAKVFTGLANKPWVEAVGVRNGVIAALGGNAEVKAALPGAVDLGLDGTLVAPGFVDAHTHATEFGRSLLMVDLRNLPSLAACREKIKVAAAELKPGQWLFGCNWNQNFWSEGREPDKSDLDDLVPHNPAVMTRVCTHSHWVNSKALEAIGIDAGTPDPPGGQYDRYESGQLTGMLREAFKMIREVQPQPGFELLERAALAAQQEAIKHGLTGLHSCESLREWKVWSKLDREGKLKFRVHHLFQPENFDELDSLDLKPGQGSGRLWLGHLKLFSDGSLGVGTALLCEDYSDEPGCRGLAFLELPELIEKIKMAYERGFDVAIHAIGDQAGNNALNAFAACREEFPGARRDRIEHIQLHCTKDLDRYREMGIAASVQPSFVATDWKAAERRFGESRCRERGYAWKTLLNNGLRMQFGSDAPVESINPLVALQAAVLRQDQNLEPAGGWLPEERLSLEEALTGFTSCAAWTARKDEHLGSLKPGNWADLTVIEKDLSQTPPQEWRQVEAAATIIGGEIVYTK